MFLKDLTVFQALTRQMNWLSARQSVLAQNIANADTPGYKAKDIEKLDFRDLVQRGRASSDGPARVQFAHFESSGSRRDADFRPAKTEAFDRTPNENSVVLEDEIIKVNDTRQAYDLAASLYRKHVQLMKMAIGGRGGG